MKPQELRNMIASHETQVALMQRELLQYQSFKIVSSAYEHVIDHGPLDYQQAQRIELKHKQYAQQLEDDHHEKAYRECVTAVPYKWLDTDELVFPNAWKSNSSRYIGPYESFDFSQSTIDPTFMNVTAEQ